MVSAPAGARHPLEGAHVTTDENDQDEAQQDEQASGEGGTARPEHPQAHPTETVQALEDEQADDDPADGQRLSGDDVTENPDSDEMEGLPGPPSGEAGEPSG